MNIDLIKNRHILVKHNENVVQNETGDWLVLDLENNSMFYVTPTLQVLNFFEITNDNELINYDSTNNESIQQFSENNIDNNKESNKENCASVGKWNRNAILSLIELFKENYNKFKSTTIKNEHVWTEITKKMNENNFNYTKSQIENKFKYLKQRYIKKKDNMGNKSSGQSPIVFDYFLEFDDIFGSKPNVKPLAIASSSKLVDSPDSTDENDEPEKKKIKTSRLDQKVDEWKELFTQKDQEKEEARERRHRERMEMAEKTMNIYEKLMDKLIDKF